MVLRESIEPGKLAAWHEGPMLDDVVDASLEEGRSTVEVPTYEPDFSGSLAPPSKDILQTPAHYVKVLGKNNTLYIEQTPDEAGPSLVPIEDPKAAVKELLEQEMGLEFSPRQPENGGCASVYFAHKDGKSYVVKIATDTLGKLYLDVGKKDLDSQLRLQNVEGILAVVGGTISDSKGERAVFSVMPHGGKDYNVVDCNIRKGKKQRKAGDTRKELKHLEDLTRIVAGMHEKGLVHRDIKKGNILIEDDGTVNLIDFGVACKDGHLSKSVVGTPKYMAPEQIFMDEITCATDTYAIGLLLYEAITNGKSAVWKKDQELITQGYNAADPDQPFLDEEKLEIGLEMNVHANQKEFVQEFFKKALHYKPEKRYQTAGEMLNDVKRLRLYAECMEEDPAVQKYEGKDEGKTQIVVPRRSFREMLADKATTVVDYVRNRAA